MRMNSTVCGLGIGTLLLLGSALGHADYPVTDIVDAAKRGDYHAVHRLIEDSPVNIGATEMHIVGGLHPWLPFDYYTDMLQAIRQAAPSLHIKAFTAVEIVHLARISKRPNEPCSIGLPF